MAPADAVQTRPEQLPPRGLTRDSKVSIGLVITLLGGLWYFNNGLEDRFDSNEQHLASMDGQMGRLTMIASTTSSTLTEIKAILGSNGSRLSDVEKNQAVLRERQQNMLHRIEALEKQ